MREGGEWREEEVVVGGLVELGGRCLWRQSMEPVGLLLAECSEELFPSPGPPPSPHSPAGFLRFLLDNLLQREREREFVWVETLGEEIQSNCWHK